ncbi:hypothetical protein ACQJBY_001418 [Aegilops geniculata]
MPMGGVDPSSPESLALHTGHSEADEGISEGPFGNVDEAPTASEIANMVRRQKAKRYIVMVCFGVIIFVPAVSFSSLPLFHVPVCTCASNMLHPHQRVPSNEPRESHVDPCFYMACGWCTNISLLRSHSSLTGTTYERVSPA